MKENNDLYFIGTNGQYLFVKNLLSNKELFMDALPSLKPVHFTDNGLKKIIKAIKTRYEETNQITNITELEFLLKGCKEEDIPIIKTAYKKLNDDNVEGEDIATSKCLEFIKRQEAINILTNGINNLKNSGYSLERIGNIVDKIQDIERNSCGADTSVYDMMDNIFNEPKTIKIPTGIPELDKKMNGGLSKGSLGLLIAGTGVGKTTFSSILCCRASLKDFKVLHIFFEDSKSDIGKKYYAHLTNHYTTEFNCDADREKLKQEIWNSHPNAKKALKENVKLLRMSNGTTSVDDIVSSVNKLINVQGWYPDMIFIDYIGCMETTSNETLKMTNECQAYERMTKRLESFASEYNIAIWIAQQTNRNGMIAQTANQRMGNIQGSFRVTQPCSAILYLDRTNCDKNAANLYLDKCRGGEPTEWEYIYLNNGSCQIDLSAEQDLTPDVNSIYEP